MLSAAEVLAAQGPLARRIENFAPRLQQQEMAAAVEQALDEHAVLVCEAGTGTGKTFAYLVPALLSGKKVIISTGTRNLQDQLYHKDLPVVRDALGISVTTALLKGRANYLCLHRLETTEQRGRFKSRELVDQLQRVRAWAMQTRRGDIAELAELPEEAPVWPMVTSTPENCIGTECPRYSDCHVMKARRAAQEADVVVVNHHLFFADMALREEGFGEVLPGANAFILDEAHQLPETASRFFGVALTGRQLGELAADVEAEQIKEAGDMPELRDAAQAVTKAGADLRLALGPREHRAPWRKAAGVEGVVSARDGLQQALIALEQTLKPASERGKGLESCWRRCVDLLNRLALITEAPPENTIQWYEVFKRSFVLQLTPLDIAEPFARYMAAFNCAWVFSSATLAVGDNFDFFTGRLGIGDADTRSWESPFDFEQQSMLYLPPAMPDPNSSEYTTAVVEAAVPVLEASGGRAFLLFTSHRALREAAGLLDGRLPFPMLVQGDAPRDELLARFRRLGNAVLLGTSSFWEGVDVRGSALSCVIIDRLPFAAPDDPILQARIDALREQGANPFMDYQVPNAVISLKQGVGRLIRDVDDRGVMMLCDPRLLTKSYGRVFRNSLPAMHHTRQLADVRAFFEGTGRQDDLSMQDSHPAG